MYGIENLLAGRTLVDRYHIEEVIGRGGMGAVYRATDLRLGREVAVKVIAVAAPGPDAHARLRARFHREARAAAGLHHPNIVSVYDFGTDAALDLDFLVMELLRGEDLASRLARVGPPPPALTLAILYQAARGLAAGHRAGLIHRDIKPGNLYLAPGDRPDEVQVRVLDFGIAEITADEETLTHLTLFGRSPFSPAYASPEQLRGECRLTPATDVFSLAAVGYHLLTGERAFASPDPERMGVELSAALASLRARPHIRPPLRSLLQRALAHDADDRFPHAGSFAEALEPLLATREHGTAPRDATRWVGDPEERAEPAERPRRFAFFSRSGNGAGGGNGAHGSARPEETHTAYMEPPARPAFDFPATRDPVLQPAASAPPSSSAVVPRRRRGRLWRAVCAVWNFCLTTAVIVLFVGSWALAVEGVEAGDPELALAGIIASVIVAPWLVYRIMGRRGRYRLALLGSIAATLGSIFLLGLHGDPHLLLGMIFTLQILTSLVLVRLTRRPDPHPLAEPPRTPIRA